MDRIPQAYQSRRPSTLRPVHLQIPIVQLDPDLPLPAYAHEGDAGLDLYAREGVVIPGRRRSGDGRPPASRSPSRWASAASSCLAAGSPSSTASAWSTHPASSMVAYRWAEVRVVLLNTDPAIDYEITRGDRIAQLVIHGSNASSGSSSRLLGRRRSRRRLRSLRPLSTSAPGPEIHVCVALSARPAAPQIATQTWIRTGSGGSAPGEDGLFEVGDPFVDAAVEAHPAELHEQGAGRCVDQVAPERHLHHRAIALGDRPRTGASPPASNSWMLTAGTVPRTRSGFGAQHRRRRRPTPRPA